MFQSPRNSLLQLPGYAPPGVPASLPTVPVPGSPHSVARTARPSPGRGRDQGVAHDWAAPGNREQMGTGNWTEIASGLATWLENPLSMELYNGL